MKPTWNYEISGDDLVVRNIIATCFGGAFDKGDNGETESGVLNDGRNPNLFGVALPIRSVEGATRNSPLAFKGPHIPWHTGVWVWREADGESHAILCSLIDNGPDTLVYPTHALDLTPAAALRFNPSCTVENVANTFEGHGFSYRIIGGAKWVS